MEVIKGPVAKRDIDQMAENLFHECLRILGGLRRLVEYGRLTWLPSLAEAAYVILLKEEMLKTSREIAETLGITEQTVKNILRSDVEAVRRYLEGEIEKVDEHIAGGIAKMAYEKMKRERGVFIKEGELEALGVGWAMDVIKRLRDATFPLNPEELRERLKGVRIDGGSAEELVERLEKPIESMEELLRELRRLAEDR